MSGARFWQVPTTSRGLTLLVVYLEQQGRAQLLRYRLPERQLTTLSATRKTTSVGKVRRGGKCRLSSQSVAGRFIL
jgi:hypothetical protein